MAAETSTNHEARLLVYTCSVCVEKAVCRPSVTFFSFFWLNAALLKLDLDDSSILLAKCYQIKPKLTITLSKPNLTKPNQVNQA